MADDEIRKQLREVKSDLDETGSRIRRYTLDPRLRAMPEQKLLQGPNLNAVAPDDTSKRLRDMADQAWVNWLAKRKKYGEIAHQPTPESVEQLELDCMELDRSVDLLQREL